MHRNRNETKRSHRLAATKPDTAAYYLISLSARACDRSQSLHKTHKILFLSKEKSWEDRNRSGNGRQRQTIYDSKTLYIESNAYGPPHTCSPRWTVRLWQRQAHQSTWCNRINACVCVSYFAALVESSTLRTNCLGKIFWIFRSLRTEP